MPKAKIRHGMAFYHDDDGNQLTAWRGQVVDLSQEDYDYLERFGAILKPDDELPVHGKLMPLPNLASDEELIAWASVATEAEIREAVAAHPALADRLVSAFDTVKDRLKAQDELLSGLSKPIADGKRKSKARAKANAKAAKTTEPAKATTKAKAADATKADDELEEEELDEDDPRSVVQEDADYVSEFLSNHPDAADDILAAEEEAATNNDREVRPAVIEAVRLAKSNTQ